MFVYTYTYVCMFGILGISHALHKLIIVCPKELYTYVWKYIARFLSVPYNTIRDEFRTNNNFVF